jgi:uncharacterized repeat protein (TIGR03803 family)
MRKTSSWISCIRWRRLIGLVGAFAVMSIVMSSGEELKHVPPAAPSFIVLHAFTGGDGSGPIAGLLRDGAGNLYGTTRNGGDSGAGVVFKVSPTGAETVLHSFTGGADGGYPFAGLIGDVAGNLYGTTAFGGAENFDACYHPGNQTCGVVFKLSPSGAETVLYTFTGGVDGGNPYATLLPDAAGNLYGTTNEAGAFGAGVVFKVGPASSETVLYTFADGADGGAPFTGGLIRDVAGNLYGTTPNGGASRRGVVFELIRCSSAPAGYDFKLLHSFTGGADGGKPFAGLIRDAAGNLYGTTTAGGASGNGVVFKLSPVGTETVLYNFTGGADGAYPTAGLVRDAAGNLYGTTVNGGANTCTNGCGVVFELIRCGSAPSGYDFKVLHTFRGADGANPAAGLILDAAGKLYGTAGGGANGAGVVFRLTP